MVLFALLSGLSQTAAGPLIASVSTDQARYAPNFAAICRLKASIS